MTLRPLHTSLHDTHASDPAIATDPGDSLDDTHASETDIAVSHRSDQIDLKDHPVDYQDSELLSGLINKIAEYYQLTPSKYRQLWSVLKGKDHLKVRSIFVVMQRQVIRDPIAYYITALGNNGSGHQTFLDFANSL